MLTCLVDFVGIYYLIGIVWALALLLRYYLTNEHNRVPSWQAWALATALLVGWFPWIAYLIYDWYRTKKRGH